MTDEDLLEDLFQEYLTESKALNLKGKTAVGHAWLKGFIQGLKKAREVYK